MLSGTTTDALRLDGSRVVWATDQLPIVKPARVMEIISRLGEFIATLDTVVVLSLEEVELI